jgi:hypothetical protein
MSYSISLDKEVHEIKEVYARNITFNVSRMAVKSGSYNCLFEPEKHGITLAVQLILPLEKAIRELERRPNYYRRYENKNDWGTFEQFLDFVKEYLKACKEHPDSEITINK